MKRAGKWAAGLACAVVLGLTTTSVLKWRGSSARTNEGHFDKQKAASEMNQSSMSRISVQQIDRGDAPGVFESGTVQKPDGSATILKSPDNSVPESTNK